MDMRLSSHSSNIVNHKTQIKYTTNSKGWVNDI